MPGRVTVSRVAKNLSGSIGFSQRQIERTFAEFVGKFSKTTEGWKDEHGHYSVEEKNEAILEAIVIELHRDSGYAQKMLKDRREEVNPDDVITFFNNIAQYTQGRVDEETWCQFLAGLDEDIHYSFWYLCGEIFGTINATILNIEHLPYPHQVDIMKDLRNLVRKKWADEIFKELDWIIKEKQALMEIEKELNEDEADS